MCLTLRHLQFHNLCKAILWSRLNLISQFDEVPMWSTRNHFLTMGMEEGALGFLLCYFYYVGKARNSGFKTTYNKYITITSPFASFLLLLLHVSVLLLGSWVFLVSWGTDYFRGRYCSKAGLGELGGLFPVLLVSGVQFRGSSCCCSLCSFSSLVLLLTLLSS